LRRITWGLAVVAAVTLTLSGCASGANTGTDSSSSTGKFVQKSPLKIGYSVFDRSDPYWDAYVKGIQFQAKKYKASVVISDDKSSEQVQVSGSANLINQGISALIVSPIQPSALPATVNAAHAAKIPIIIGDVGAVGNYDAYVLSDNYNGGVLAAKYMIDAFKGKPGVHEVGIVSLLPDVAVGVDRVKGFTDTLAKDSSFKIVSTLVGQTVDVSYRAAQDMITANPNIAAIYGVNGNSALGASKALIAAGKSPKNGFVLVGFNGDPGEITAIAAGEETATIAQDSYGQGKLDVDIAMDLLKGKKIAFDDESTRTKTFPVEVVDAKSLDAYKAKIAARK
jgi:ribose transport system substrate-binding protein